MSSVENFIDKRLIELGLDPAEFTDPEKTVIYEKLQKEANRLMSELKIRDTRRVVCESGQTNYSLRDVQAVESVKLNGIDITRCRVSQASTFSSENRS